MIKNIYIIVFLFAVFFANAQKDTLAKRSNIYQLLGIEGGYTSRHIIIGNKGDIGLSYMYNHKYLLTKAKISFTPGSNFGLLTKFFVNAGFTTNINKKVSWNLLGGFGITYSDKIYSFGNPANPSQYSYGSITPIIETGLLFKAFKLNHFFFGFNGSSYIEKMGDINTYGSLFHFRIFVLNLNANILFKF